MEKQRFHALDDLRGLCLISMAAYHGLWNLVYLFGVPMAWYRGPVGYLWQQSICWTFILLSGFCWRLGRRHLRRGLLIFAGGILVSLVTHLAVAGGEITFGVLTCLGSCVLLTIPLDRVLKKLPAPVFAAVSFGLFLLLRDCNDGCLGFEGLVLGSLPEGLYRNLFTTYLGFPMAGFRSADYFSLCPWFFLFLTGYFLQGVFHERAWDRKLFTRGGRIPLLNWLGRHSLGVYLLHQPVLYGLCMVWQMLAVGQ